MKTIEIAKDQMLIDEIQTILESGIDVILATHSFDTLSAIAESWLDQGRSMDVMAGAKRQRSRLAPVRRSDKAKRPPGCASGHVALSP